MDKDRIGAVIQMFSERVYIERLARRVYDECSQKYTNEHNCLGVGYCIDPQELAQRWYWYCKSN